MGYTSLSNLSETEGPLDYENPVFYNNDRAVLLLQTNSFGQQANVTIRKMKRGYVESEGGDKNFHVEVGAIYDGTSVVFEFTDDQFNAALPCPPYDNKPPGSPVDL